MVDSYDYLGNYIGRLARGSVQLAQRALAFGSKCLDLDNLIAPATMINRRRDSDVGRPYHLDSLAQNPNHAHNPTRYQPS